MTMTPAPGPARRIQAALSFRQDLDPWLFTDRNRERLAAVADVVGTRWEGPGWREQVPALRGAEVLLASWGAPRLDEAVLSAMPNLRLVAYAAGSVKALVSDEFWRRGIMLTSAVAANAGPTATFAEAMIVLALKQAWLYLREARADWASLSDTESSGVHGATVGIIGLSRVGREVVRALRRHELRILAHDPTVGEAEAAAAGVELAPLEELFARADVVSLHAPLLPATRGLVGGALLRRMRRHAAFVNTARGAIVREDELVAVLRERPDLTAILDVTDPEPAPADSPLRHLPNVVLTPHLAGARHREIELLGRAALEELGRFAHGEPLRWALTEAAVELQA